LATINRIRVMQPGMTFAYESMVVVEGLGTGVAEDSVVIIETGYDLLTAVNQRRR
jgi:Xaa-Pro aminopeptidase